MYLTHRGQMLTSDQVAIVAPILAAHVAEGREDYLGLQREVDEALLAAGCPVPGGPGYKPSTLSGWEREDHEYQGETAPMCM